VSLAKTLLKGTATGCVTTGIPILGKPGVIMNFVANRLSTLAIALLSTGAFTACGGDGSDATSFEPAIDAASIADLEARADRLVAAGVPGVSVAVLAGEQTVLIARGVADRATGASLSPDHRFRVASMTKSVVASIVLQLVDEGRLSLSDSVEDWLPGMLPENADASIESLLRLQSGIFSYDRDERHMAPYFAGDLQYSWAPEALVGLAAEHPAVFAPGERFDYSNTNYVLLALIVEKITGDTLANAVHSRITKPLGMSASSMPTGSRLPEPYSHGYMLGLADEPIDVTDISASSVFGNGKLVSTARDVALFYGALARGEVVSSAQQTAMFSPDPNVDTHYGMGVFRFDDEFPPCGRFVGHDGAAPGYDSTAFSNLDGTRQYAVLTNNLAPGDVVGSEEAQAAFKDLIVAAACS
jgi:D-alanyl-D-alanine carboxypeptidase